MTNYNKTEVLNWFLSLSREVFMRPNETNRLAVKPRDLDKWSVFDSRMREIASEAKLNYAPYDLTIKRNGVWYYNVQGYYLFVMANMGTIARVPELKPVMETWQSCQEASLKIRSIEHKLNSNPDKIQDKAQQIMRSSYRQMAMQWAEVGAKTPLYNMGV